MAFPRRSKGGETGTRTAKAERRGLLLEVGSLLEINTGSRVGVVNVSRSSGIKYRSYELHPAIKAHLKRQTVARKESVHEQG